DLEDVPQIPGVGRGARIRFLPALIAGPPRELGQRRSAFGVRLPLDLVGRDELGVRDQADLPPDELGHRGSPSVMCPAVQPSRCAATVAATSAAVSRSWRPGSPVNWTAGATACSPQPVAIRSTELTAPAVSLSPC